jgi:hypothetical protein
MLRPEGAAGCLGCPVRDELLSTQREAHAVLDRRRWRGVLHWAGRLLRSSRGG